MRKMPKHYTLVVCQHCAIRLIVRKNSPYTKFCGVCTEDLSKAKKVFPNDKEEDFNVKTPVVSNVSH